MKGFLLVCLSLMIVFYSSYARSNDCEIFVARLNFDTQDHELREVFEIYGIVNQAQVVIDNDSGKSRGFGFVKMANCQNAQVAISELNGFELQGSAIVVKFKNGTSVKRVNNNNNSRGGNSNKGSSNRRY